MMSGQGRARTITNELDNMDLGDWPVKDKPAKPRPDRAETRKTAEANGFPSREPVPVAGAALPAPKQRRWRTGRNVQFNLRATPETIAAFTAIADENGWSLGETFEKATELLKNNRRS